MDGSPYYTRFGYTFTGDFTSRGQTGTMWFLPSRAVPTTTGMGPYVFVAGEGANGWEMLSAPLVH